MYEKEIESLLNLKYEQPGHAETIDTAIALMRAADRKCPTCNHEKTAHPGWCHTEVK